jgi:hypothetical protein
VSSVTQPPPVPAFDHIFIVIMENHGYEEIIGSPDAPYINQLAARCGVATNYVSVAHPSLPNYLALTGGDTFGITTDCTDCFQQAPNLVVDRVAASGRTWRAYMESMPSPGFVGDAYPYMQKHDPFIYYDNLRTRPPAPGRRWHAVSPSSPYAPALPAPCRQVSSGVPGR